MCRNCYEILEIVLVIESTVVEGHRPVRNEQWMSGSGALSSSDTGKGLWKRITRGTAHDARTGQFNLSGPRRDEKKSLAKHHDQLRRVTGFTGLPDGGGRKMFLTGVPGF